MGSGSAYGDGAYNMGNGFVDLFHKSNADRDQNNKGHIKIYRDGENKRSQADGVNRFCFGECFYNL